MDNEIILKVRNLKTFFYTNERCNRAINGVSFDVKRGKTLSLVGESGSGKSVTASSIMQLLPELSRIEEGEITYFSENGEIRIDKLEKNSTEMRSLRGADIAMIFQDPMTALNPVYTVGFQIVESLRVHMDMSKKEATERAIELLSLMGIPNPEQRVKDYPHQFSGGMRQRVMIAMAMSCNPKVLIADEPTTALDVTIQAQIFELINVLKKEFNTAVLLITHDMGVVNEVSDDMAVMYMGNILESGSTKQVIKNPAHPYTEALLRSIPVLGKGRSQKLEPIRGTTPDPYQRPKGCQFRERCDYACEKCLTMPPEELVSPGHMVRCWNYKEVLANGKKQ